MWQVVCLILLCSITGCANQIEDKGLETCIKWEDTHNKLRLDFQNSLVKRGVVIVEQDKCYRLQISKVVKSYFIQRDNDASAMWYQYKLRVLEPKDKLNPILYSVVKQNSLEINQEIDHQAMRYFSTQFIQLIHEL